jgi:hypothetical protein
LDRGYADPKRTQMPAPATIPSKTLMIDGGNKVFHDKTKFAQYNSTNLPLQRIIKGKHQHKDRIYTLEKARK